MIEDIKGAARRRLALDGPDLALRAVARDLGIVPSALYRYFGSRDALLTALITDAYDELGAAAEAAEAAVDRADLRGRWMALCRAVRTWALSNPAEYTLLYGSPVPGYTAPADTTPPASRVAVALVSILNAAAATGSRTAVRERPSPEGLRADLARLVEQAPGGAVDARPSDGVMLAGLAAWTQLYGLVGFEVFGRLNDMFTHLAEHFDHQMEAMADAAGLP